MELNRLPALVQQRMQGETPSASRAGEPTRLRLKYQARHQREIKRLQRTAETQRFEAHRPPWPEPSRLESASEAGAILGLESSQAARCFDSPIFDRCSPLRPCHTPS